MEAIQALKRARCTVVVISHKTSMLAGVDKLLVMNMGRVKSCSAAATRCWANSWAVPESPRWPTMPRLFDRFDNAEETHPKLGSPRDSRLLVITSTFVVLGGWSALARLDSAITAQGVVSAETNRKTVQHLEGGIVREIRVREGQHVDCRDRFCSDLNRLSRRRVTSFKETSSTPGCAGSPLIAERDEKGEFRFRTSFWSGKMSPMLSEPSPMKSHNFTKEAVR